MTEEELSYLLPTVIHPEDTFLFRELEDTEIQRLYSFLAVGYNQLRNGDIPTKADHVTIFWETALELDRRDNG